MGSEKINHFQKSELISWEQEGKLICLDAVSSQTFLNTSADFQARITSSDKLEKI